MLMAYVNYPMSKISAHRDPGCGFIQAQNKPSQRIVRINITSLSEELRKFKNKNYRFSSTAAWNDMWLAIDLEDRDFEMDVLGHIQQILGQQYKPFSEAHIETHC